MRHRIVRSLRLFAAVGLGLLGCSGTGVADAQPAGQRAAPFVGLWTSGSADHVTYLDQLGVGWARSVAAWELLQPAPDTYAWASLDAQIDAAAGNGRRVLVIVRNNPAWAAASRCRISTDAERDHLANFLTALVTRYKDRVSYWQLYNEMDNTSEAFDQQYDLGGCFGTAGETIPTQQGRDDYAQMLGVAGAAIHAADPAAKVISGALVSGNFLSPECPTCLFDADFGKGVLSSLRANGTLDQLDYVAVHFFSSQQATYALHGTDLLGRVNKLRQDMRDAGLSEAQMKPIVVDEGSYTGQANATSTADPSYQFNVDQRNYVVKALARAAAADVVAYFWFWLQDTSGGLGGDNAYGLMTTDGTPKPSFQAMQYFLSLVQRRDQFVGRLTLASPKLEGYEFTTLDGRRLQIIWNEADQESVSYSPSDSVAAITDLAGASLPDGDGRVAVGPEPRYIFVSTP